MNRSTGGREGDGRTEGKRGEARREILSFKYFFSNSPTFFLLPLQPPSTTETPLRTQLTPLNALHIPPPSTSLTLLSCLMTTLLSLHMPLAHSTLTDAHCYILLVFDSGTHYVAPGWPRTLHSPGWPATHISPPASAS